MKQMDSAIFYDQGTAIHVMLPSPVTVPAKRTLKGWAIGLYILAAMILAGSLDSWASAPAVNQSQEISIGKD